MHQVIYSSTLKKIFFHPIYIHNKMKYVHADLHGNHLAMQQTAGQNEKTTMWQKKKGMKSISAKDKEKLEKVTARTLLPKTESEFINRQHN